MRTLVPAVLALLLALPVAAQDRSFDLTGNFVWMDPTGEGTFEDLTDPTDLEIESDAGYGLAANIFFGNRISAEFAVARVDTETRLSRRRAVLGPGGNLEIIPVTAVLQFHFAPNAFLDPYVGAGAAYVLYDFSKSQGVSNIDEIDFEDDAALVVNAGLGIRLGSRWGITLDGKYVPLESEARAVVIDANEESAGEIDVSPIILSAGITLRF